MSTSSDVRADAQHHGRARPDGALQLGRKVLSDVDVTFVAPRGDSLLDELFVQPEGVLRPVAPGVAEEYRPACARHARYRCAHADIVVATVADHQGESRLGDGLVSGGQPPRQDPHPPRLRQQPLQRSERARLAVRHVPDPLGPIRVRRSSARCRAQMY